MNAFEMSMFVEMHAAVTDPLAGFQLVLLAVDSA